MTDNKKDDFTTLDLMPEYIHEENAEVDNLFNEAAAGVLTEEPSLEAPIEETPISESEAEANQTFETETPIESTDTVEEPGQLNFNNDFNSEPASGTESTNDTPSELGNEDNTFGSDNFNFEEASTPPDETIEEIPVVLEEEPSFETEVKKASPPPPREETIEKPRTPPESLSEVKVFAENMNYGKVGVGGNPPFSIILKNIKFEEDAEDILIILKEFGIATNENEASLKQSINNGSIIISQISEYAAVFLTHKLRRFQADILMGLSEEIHPSKGISIDFKGLTSKETLFQNKKEFVEFNPDEIDLKSIIVTTTQSIEGRTIKYYIGVASEHLILNESELVSGTELIQSETPSLTEKGHLKIHDYLSEIQLKIAELNKLSEQEEAEMLKKYKINLQDLYEELALKLKRQAQTKKGNAVIGVNYQINPLALELGKELKYKITCTGSIVWIK